jgi:hypothetical protein
MAKVVLSTNIAESSITIPDVTAVVDLTLCRSHEYNDERQMPALVLMHASRACMKQRAGRAGRLRPGVCLRLLTRSLHDAQPEFPAPDIGRVPLENVVLTTRAMFPSSLSVQQLLAEVLDPPPEDRVHTTISSLAQIGALEAAADARAGDATVSMKLTRLGEFASSMPLDVKLSKLVRERRLFSRWSDCSDCIERGLNTRRSSGGSSGPSARTLIHPKRKGQFTWMSCRSPTPDQWCGLDPLPCIPASRPNCALTTSENSRRLVAGVRVLRPVLQVMLGLALGCVADAVVMAAGLSSQDPFSMPSRAFDKEVEHLAAKQRANQSARLAADGGLYCQASALRTAYADWLTAGPGHAQRAVKEAKHTLHSGRMHALDLLVVEVASRVESAAKRAGLALDAAATAALAALRRQKAPSQASGGAGGQHDRRVRESDAGVVRAVLAAAAGDDTLTHLAVAVAVVVVVVVVACLSYLSITAQSLYSGNTQHRISWWRSASCIRASSSCGRREWTLSAQSFSQSFQSR